MSLANIDIQILKDLDRYNSIPVEVRDQLRQMSLVEWEHLCYTCYRHYNAHFREQRGNG